jgi:hypothetical protein
MLASEQGVTKLQATKTPPCVLHYTKPTRFASLFAAPLSTSLPRTTLFVSTVTIIQEHKLSPISSLNSIFDPGATMLMIGQKVNVQITTESRTRNSSTEPLPQRRAQGIATATQTSACPTTVHTGR